MRRRHSLLAATMLALSAPAFAGPAEDFQKLQDDYWAATLRDNPAFASSVGFKAFDRELAPLSLLEMDRVAAENAALLKRLEAIPAASLPASEQTNRAVLKRQLEDAIEGNRYGQRQLLYSTLGSYHDNLAGMAENIPFRSYADYDNYLARLELVPRRMQSYGEISAKAAREGFVQPCVTMTNFASTINGNITPDVAQSRFYVPFAVQRPANIPADQWTALQGRARTLITTKINPAYRSFADLYDRELKGKCRQSVGVSAMPQGKEYYAFQVRSQTTTNLTPEEIHQLGLREVARIRAEMVEVAKKAGFPSREAMIADMRTNPKWFVTTPDDLLKATALMTKTIDGKMPSLFGRLPRLPYGIRPMALATAPGDTTARYQPGSPAAGIAGFYLVNTTKLDQRPLWEIPALTVHEAVPGHHMQLSIAQEVTGLPKFRQQGAWHVDIAGIQRGDIVFFDWGGSDVKSRIDHVGIVTGADAGGVYTIEGNYNDVCDRHVRYSNWIAGYGRPAYAGGSMGVRVGFVTYPGASFFVMGRRSPIIEAMHDRLMAEGCNGYQTQTDKDVWGTGDVRSYALWQNKCGFFGPVDANGIPGRTTWDRLKVPRT